MTSAHSSWSPWTPSALKCGKGTRSRHKFGRSTWAVALDHCAVPVWWQKSETRDTKITRVRMGRDRRSVVYSEFDESRQEDLGQIKRVSLDDDRVTVTRAMEQHHDFVELPDGRVAWLAWDRRPNDWFVDSEETEVIADAVLVAPEGVDDEHVPERLFSFWHDVDAEPFWSCSHMRGAWASGLDWPHTNSIVFHEGTGEWTLNARQWDATLRLTAPEPRRHAQVDGRRPAGRLPAGRRYGLAAPRPHERGLG